jgi:hypothetical protein
MGQHLLLVFLPGVLCLASVFAIADSREFEMEVFTKKQIEFQALWPRGD